MNYAEFYTSAKRMLIDSIVSIWFRGKAKEHEYMRHILTEEEPLLSEPVFQSIFPWEESRETFEEHATKLKILSKDFVHALSDTNIDEELRFPLKRHPYKHQTKSWETMLSTEGKTIVVTSGTGSGKTECFMIPVLQDIAKRNEKDCVQAIFLYPLNALMKSQQRRIHAWCNALPSKVTYAIYNGDTEKDAKSTSFTDPYYPQLITRPQIRTNPPQILFTNPTMLNYMLIRAEDRNILEKSKGKLKWILLDEAHTYTGSSAAELSLQLRRVLDAFDVNIEQVNFAVTSATIGDENDPNTELKLKTFVSQLTGKKIQDIEVISGKRIIPEMDIDKATSALCNINAKFGTNISFKCIEELRKQLNSKPVISAKDITKQIDQTIGKDVVKSLELIDALANKIDGLNKTDGASAALLPSRAHYFIRSINGVYACVNQGCCKHKDIRIGIGSLTTYQNTNCPECKSKMLEVATCPSCGGSIVFGETSTSKGYRMHTNTIDLDTNPFFNNNDDLIDEETQDEEIQITQDSDGFTPFYFSKPESKCLRRNTTESEHIFNHSKGRIEVANEQTEPTFIYKSLIHSEKNTSLCPHCGNTIRRLNYLRASATQMGRILSTLILDNAEPSNASDANILYEGRKYITFTDNRQGSARYAMGQNQDIERSWVRSSIFHKLADIRLEKIEPAGLTTEEEQSYIFLKKIAEKDLPPILKSELARLEAKCNGTRIIPDAPKVAWEDISQKLENNSDLRKLYKHINDARGDSRCKNESDYLKALMVDQFGWIPKRANSLETLGLIHLVYPDIEKAKCPRLLLNKDCCNKDWQDFIKICIDYLIRGGRHYMISGDYMDYLTQNKYTSAIYPMDSTLRIDNEPVDKWPTLNMNMRSIPEGQNRLILLLCAVLGYDDVNNFSTSEIANINSLMKDAWDFITGNILEVVDNNNCGYMLDLLGSKVKLQLLDKGFLCPVDNVIVDVTFRGYSPRMNGYIGKSNYERFKVKQEFTNPYFPFKTEDKNEDAIKKWINDNFKDQRKAGIFTDIHERIYLQKPIFISAEHSAQQTPEVREKYEREFNAGHLNILSCSTTMEMGVDIGGISEVVMNNVPPKSANYLQRAGRAGRRNESKALALTFCAPNPIGLYTWDNPSYPITHITETPLLKMESRQLIQRHVNALIFSSFVSKQQGEIRVTSRLEEFFMPKDGESYYDKLLIYIDEIKGGQLHDLDASYDKLVCDTALYNTPITDTSYITKKDIKRAYDTYSAHLEALDKSLKSLENKDGITTAKNVISHQRNKFLKTELLSYLAENSFLPSAGIPTGLVQCELTDGSKKSSRNDTHFPTMHLSQAISSYAPGNLVVKNEWIYKPAGIRLKTKYDNNTSRYILQNCTNCGYTTINYGNIMNHCPKCDSQNSMRGIRNMNINMEQRFTEVVEPAAFTVAWGSKPTRKMNERNSMNFVQPILLEMDSWPDESSAAKITVRCSTPRSEILFYNRGRSGYGYAFCPICGKMESEKDIDSSNNVLAGHRHLSTGKPCSGDINVRHHVLLVGRYQTDFAEIRFYDETNNLITDADTLYSLGVVLSRKLTELLGVNDDEIDFGYSGVSHSIFIYDTALGGAGYSPLFREYKDTVMEMAYNSLKDCDCERSCTKCLIDRRSQWYLNYLNRQKALEWLEIEQKARIAPDSIKNNISDASAITSDFASEFYHLSKNKDIKAIKVFVDNNYASWQPADFPYIKIMTEMGLTGIDVTFVLSRSIDLTSCPSSTRTILLSALFQYQFSYLNGSMPGSLKPILAVTFTDNTEKTYFGENVITSLSKEWGNGDIYSTMKNCGLSFNTLDTSSLIMSMSYNDDSVMFDTRIKDDSNLDTLLKSLMYERKDKWQKIKSAMTGKSVSLEYSDRYLHTPLGCMLLAHLVASLKENFNLNILHFNIYVTKPSNFNSNGSSQVNACTDYENNDMRNKFLSDSINALAGITPEIIDTGYIEHERCLTIKTKIEELCIRPDAGISHGWKPFGRGNATITDEDFTSDWNLKMKLYNQKKNYSGILYTISYNKY